MNDQVNRVIAAILNSENQVIEGGARRRKSKTTHHEGGIVGNIRHNQRMHGGSVETEIAGGQCGASYYGPSYGRYIMGGSTEATEAKPVDSVVAEPTAAALTGGKSRSRSKRKLPPALKRNQERVMARFRELKKRYPNKPGNELMKMAMKSAARSK